MTPHPLRPSDPPLWSRRGVFALAAALSAGALPGCSVQGQPGGQQAWSASTRSGRKVVSENSLPGNADWDITHLGQPDEIVGYTGQASVLPGEPVMLYASTTAPSFTVSAYRMGWYSGDLARLVWRSGTVAGHQQSAPAVISSTNTVEAVWDPSLTVPTHDWPEGSYLLRLDAETGGQRFAPVTVRSAGTKGRLVIKNAVETWAAYNTWGGRGLYHGPGGTADAADRSLAVSLDRPYDGNGAFLFLDNERKLIELAERSGLPLAYITGMDLEADPRLLDGASALLSPGHDEYWSPPQRATVTAARDAGMNIAFLGANAVFRRTRLESTRVGPRRLIVCYKTAYLRDPMYGKNNALVTSDWREPPSPDPESSLTGTLYESNPVSAAYVVASPDAWLFAGTGVQRGTSFPGLVGIEYDRVNPAARVERPIEILSHSPLTCRGVRSYSDSAYYTHSGGAGVFNAGTMHWVESLGGPYLPGMNAATAAFTGQVTRNLLRAFADGPAAARYPARDNLDAMREWPGDPIAAKHDLWPPVQI